MKFSVDKVKGETRQDKAKWKILVATTGCCYEMMSLLIVDLPDEAVLLPEYVKISTYVRFILQTA